MSLKNQIKYYLDKNGFMSLRELENLCKSAGFKLSNAERRLRELMSTGGVMPVKNSAGAIIAYKTVLDNHLTITPLEQAEPVLTKLTVLGSNRPYAQS